MPRYCYMDIVAKGGLDLREDIILQWYSHM